jgi:hypothetical protein
VPELTALEARLTTLGRELEWPPTPDLSERVVAVIAAQQVIPLPVTTPGKAMRPGPWYQSRWAVAAAAVILAVAALLAYQPSRDTIANWLNLHTRIQQVPVLTTPSPLPPGPLGERLGLGGYSTLPKASAAVKWKVLVPSPLGAPDEVYLQIPPDGPPQGEVTLVYSARAGIPISAQTGVAVLITEARGAVNSDFFGKTVGPDTTMDPVTVAGHNGYWFAGNPHTFVFIDAAGNPRYETSRLATNTLLLDDGGTIVRIEGDLTKDQALQIAASLA